MFIKNLFKLPFNIFNKYIKILKILIKQKQNPFVFPKGSLFLGEPPMLIFNYNDFVLISIVVEDNLYDDYNNHYNITSISLTFTNYDKHRDFGENLLIDNSESNIHQFYLSDFWVLHKKQKNQIIDLITKDQKETFSKILYDEDLSEYIYFIPFDDIAEKDLVFVTNDFSVLSAIKEFLSKVNAKKVVRETLKIATVHFYIKEQSVA